MFEVITFLQTAYSNEQVHQIHGYLDCFAPRKYFWQELFTESIENCKEKFGPSTVLGPLSTWISHLKKCNAVVRWQAKCNGACMRDFLTSWRWKAKILDFYKNEIFVLSKICITRFTKQSKLCLASYCWRLAISVLPQPRIKFSHIFRAEISELRACIHKLS